MNRCAPRHSSPLALLPLLAAALLGLPALAQTDQSTQATESTAPAEPVKPNVRKFPPQAVRGEMVVLSPPLIGMNGKQARLSVGARIRDANNHFVLSNALLNQKLVVNYVLDNTGMVHEVWILNAEEAKEKRPGDSTTFFNFITGGGPSKPAQADNGKTPYDQLPAYKR
jgi:hypothetical protein